MIIALFVSGLAWFVGIPIYDTIANMGTTMTTGTNVQTQWGTAKGIMDYVVIISGFLCIGGILLWAFVRGQRRERESMEI